MPSYEPLRRTRHATTVTKLEAGVEKHCSSTDRLAEPVASALALL